MNTLNLIGTALLVLLTWIYLHFKKNYKLWKTLNVPYLEPTFPCGNVMEIIKTKLHFAYIMENVYKELKSITDIGYGGIYFFKDPVLVVTDPEFAKTIMVKDFNYFVDRGVYSNEKVDPLSANLFFLEGQKWKNLRAKITPVFTSGKLKIMFHTIVAVGDELNKHLMPIAEKGQDIDIRDMLGRFMTDIIGSCAFGIDCNSLEDPNSQFRVMGKKMINFPKLQSLKVFFAMMFRDTARKLNIRFNTKEVSDFFMNVVRDTIEYRERNNVRRNDFLQLMLDLKDKGTLENDDGRENSEKLNEAEKLTFEEIAAQSFVFFFAGFETSATTMTYALHLLSRYPEVQQKARDEVNRVLEKYDGKFTYDAMVEMSYLENIISETLRMYPPVATLHRSALTDYKLPNGSILPKGTGVVINVLAFQRDPEHFPDPMQFDPDRFTNEVKATRHPFSYLPFGEGMRICIGMRFGLLQTKLGLAMLLKNFKFNVCTKTEIPLKIDTVNMLHAPLGEVFLNIEKC